MNPSEINSIQHNLQITLSENQINRLAEVCGFLTRHRKILPYSLVLSLLTAPGKDSNAGALTDLWCKFNERVPRRPLMIGEEFCLPGSTEYQSRCA